MAQSFSGGEGIEDGSLVAVQAPEASLISPLAGDNIIAPSSSSHPSRPPTPLGNEPAPYYTPYSASQPISVPIPPPRPLSNEPRFQSRTPELELDHGSRDSSVNYGGKTIKVVQWTPQRGEEGTQVTIILDSAVIRFAQPSLHNPSLPPNFGPGSSNGGNESGPVNRSFSVLFGQAAAPTEFTRAQAIDGNGVGHVE